MAGIVFMKTLTLENTVKFYTKEIGAKIWVNQEDCIILKHNNFLFGFCQREGSLNSGWLITFFYQTKEEVDSIYEKLKEFAKSEPTVNLQYNIYHFFAKDPENRNLEFQTFLNEIDFNWKYNSY